MTRGSYGRSRGTSILHCGSYLGSGPKELTRSSSCSGSADCSSSRIAMAEAIEVAVMGAVAATIIAVAVTAAAIAALVAAPAAATVAAVAIVPAAFYYCAVFRCSIFTEH